LSCGQPPASPGCNLIKGDAEGARNVLDPVYRRLTEGFGTADLKPASICWTSWRAISANTRFCAQTTDVKVAG